MPTKKTGTRTQISDFEGPVMGKGYAVDRHRKKLIIGGQRRFHPGVVFRCGLAKCLFNAALFQMIF